MQGLISNWDIHINEESNNLYKITAKRVSGESFESISDKLIEKLIEFGLYARKINKSYNIEIKPNIFPYFDTELHEEITRNIEYILINEILHNNYITEYWSGYGNCIKLKNKFSNDSWRYIKQFRLFVDQKDDMNWGKTEIYEIDNKWKIIEPFYI